VKKKSKTHHGGTETRRRSKPILTTEDTEGHGGELETKSLLQRAQRGIKATEFAQKTKKFAISNTEARRKSKPFSPLIFADER